MYTIYKLIDPRTGEVRYIGQTEQKLTTRLTKHICEKDVNPAKQVWLRELQALNLSPIIAPLEQVETIDEAFEAERRWVKAGIDASWPLTNGSAIGTHGGSRPGAGVKAKPSFEVTPTRVRVSFPYNQALTVRTRDNLGYTEWEVTGAHAIPALNGLLRIKLADGRELEISAA